MAKQAVVIREVKSMAMSCDPVGNVLLLKLAYNGGKETCLIMPAHIIFWLLAHLPVNQDPALRPPTSFPTILEQDWDEMRTPRVDTMQCKQFNDAIRMSFQLERGPEEVALLNRSNVELMRQFMENYRGSLMDLGVF